MRPKIVIANTLKPIDDVRAFEKIAESIAKTNKYDINIIGNEGKKGRSHAQIKFLTNKLSRHSVKRIFAPFLVFVQLFRLKPQLIIICTHELLIPAMLIKLFLGARVVYDLQEDYEKNIRLLGKHPFKWFLAKWVRAKERITANNIDQFWLAEACYEEINFVRKKHWILENKAVEPRSPAVRKNDHLMLLFSGTISEYSGIKHAVALFELLQSHTSASLTIIGQCHNRKIQSWLHEIATRNNNLTLRISKHAIPHEEILKEIDKANLGLIAYQPNEVNRDKIPTKLYEYARHRLPYLIQNHSTWTSKARVLGGAFVINFESSDIQFLLKKLQNLTNLYPEELPENETWEAQEAQLTQAIKTLIIK